MTSAEFIDCKNLTRGSFIEVETASRHYRIECLGGSAVRISGHPDSSAPIRCRPNCTVP